MEFSDFEDVKNRILKLKSDLDVSNNAKFGLEDQIKQANLKAGEVKVMYENVERERQSLSKQMGELKDCIDALHAERLKLSQKLQQSQAENERLNAKLKRTDQDTDQSKDTMMKMNSELGKMSQVTAKNESQTRDLKRIREENEKLTDELDKTGSQCRNLAREIDLKNDALARARKDLEASETERSNLWTRLQQGDNDNFVERSVADNLKEENVRLTKKVEALTQAYDQAKESADEYFRENRSLKESVADFQVFQKQYEALKEESSDKGGEVGELTRKLMMVQQELEMVRAENTRVLRDSHRIKEENEIMLLRLQKVQADKNRGLTAIAKELDGL